MQLSLEILQKFLTPHMALNTGHTYTNLVNSQKFIHLFLIAMLCFGQFAASTHIAGHVHHNHSTSDLHVVGGDANAHATLARVLELRRSLAHAADNADNEEEVDCSIYHAFSGLCGTFASPDSVIVGWLQLRAILPTTESHIARATSNNHRIRAPPTPS